MFDKLEDLLIRFEEIMGELHEPTVTNNQERFRKLMKEQSDLHSHRGQHIRVQKVQAGYRRFSFQAGKRKRR